MVKFLPIKIGVSFYDLDEEIKKSYEITLEAFIKIGAIRERDCIRGHIIGRIIKNEQNCVIAISPMSNSQYFQEYLRDEDVLAIELTDSAENIFERLVFSDEDDNIYWDNEYKNSHKDYYMNDIYDDIEWYGKVYSLIKNKYNVNNDSPEDVAEKIIKEYRLIDLLKK